MTKADTQIDHSTEADIPLTEVTSAEVVSEVPTAKPLAKVAVVVDDEPANRDFLVRLIIQAQYQTYGAASGKEAIELIEKLETAPMVVMIDSELPDMDGLSLLTQFHPQYPNTKFIMATMHDSPTLIYKAFELGCCAFLVKPHGFMDLYKRLQQLPENPTILDRLVFDKYGVRQFKGASSSPA